MKWFKKLFGVIGGYFRTGRAASDAQRAFEYIGRALPCVVSAAEIVTTLTPSGVDDVTWGAIKAKYPNLLDGRPKTSDQVKAESLVLAAELLRAQCPEVSTGVARAAAQLAYFDWAALKAQA